MSKPVFQIDELDSLKTYLMSLQAIIQGFYLGCDEIDSELLKEAFGEIFFGMYDRIKSLDEVIKFLCK